MNAPSGAVRPSGLNLRQMQGLLRQVEDILPAQQYSATVGGMFGAWHVRIAARAPATLATACELLAAVSIIAYPGCELGAHAVDVLHVLGGDDGGA